MTNLHDMSRRLHGAVELLRVMQEATDDSPAGDSLFAVGLLLRGVDEDLRQAAEDAFDCRVACCPLSCNPVPLRGQNA